MPNDFGMENFNNISCCTTHCLFLIEASHKFLKVFECLDRTQSHQLIREATDVSIHSTDSTGGQGDVLLLGLDPLAYGNVEFRSSAATTLLSILDIFVAKLAALATIDLCKEYTHQHATAVYQYHNKGIARLERDY